MRRLLALVLALFAAPLAAQPNGVLLVAKPELRDPNFAQTVVLVTRAHEGGTVGVVLNRPLERRLADQPVYRGGPVMQQVIVALFAAESAPEAASFSVMQGVYLSMHPKNIDALLANPAPRMRLFAGFSGWAPRQLESEFVRDGWYVLPADEETVFRAATEGVWEELVEKAKRLAPRT